MPEQSPTTVLIAEDHPGIRGALVEALRGEGYQIIEAWNGEQAVQAITEHLPPAGNLGLVLLDMRLPYLDGKGVLHHLASTGTYVPVVALSAFPESLADATSAGAQMTLAKPFNVDDVLAAVARFCPP
jgi:CheY-like chemotaxis protein